MTGPATPHAVQTLQVYPGALFCVSDGVNLGDPLAPARDLVHEDIYELAEGARPGHLTLVRSENGALSVGSDSTLGTPGAPLYLDSLLTFMGPNGTTEEVLVVVETDAETGVVAATYLHPFAPLVERVGYTLVTIDLEGAAARLAEVACISFTRGTHITMADGRQVPVEDLAPGDRVLTRDSGPQLLRWIGRQTVRATGPFAPITIAAGALNNTGPLTVSPHHRLFIYQRVDALKTGCAEVIVRAGHLVNGTTVVQETGGFVDYFQLLFDKHEIIYAEGIAAESLFVDVQNQPIIPEAVRNRLAGGARPEEMGYELEPGNLPDEDAVTLLKRASMR